MVWHKTTQTLPLYQQTLQTFGGERTDPATGWQFLGNGNRTYNPAQRYFLSEDPAGDGYAFGSNNPIMNTDPSGNSSRWLGEIFKWAGYVSTMGLSALHQRWANITAAVIQTGCTVATLGAVAAGAGSAALASIVAGVAATGSIPVVAAAIPANKGLNIAGNIIGITEMTVTIATGVCSLLSFAIAGEAEEVFGGEIPKMLPSIAENLTKSGENISTTSGSTKPISVEFTLIHPPFNPKTAEELFEGSSFSFYDKASKTLKPDSLKNVVNIWAVLRNSPFHENIACDTGCILLAYQIAGKDLKIKSLDIFLSMRNKYINYEGSFSKEHPYIVALNNVFEGIRDHSHPGNIREYNIGNYNASKLSRIFTYYRYMLIQGYNHMVILKHAGYDNCNRLWKVYQFFSDSDNLIIRHVNTRNLNRQIFRNKDDKFSFIGYIGIMR